MTVHSLLLKDATAIIQNCYHESVYMVFKGVAIGGPRINTIHVKAPQTIRQPPQAYFLTVHPDAIASPE